MGKAGGGVTQIMAALIKELIRVLFVVVRYLTAVAVTFAASVETVSHLPHLFPASNSNINSPFWDFIWFFPTGLAGVAAGSFCLPRNHRWISSMSLLCLVLGYALIFCLAFNDFFPLVPLSIGGIVPVVTLFLQRSKSDSKLSEKEALILVASAVFLALMIFWLTYTPSAGLLTDDPN